MSKLQNTGGEEGLSSPTEFQIPFGFVGPLRLKNGGLLAIETGLNGLLSWDEGRSWRNKGRLIFTNGKDFPDDCRAWSLIRLASGKIALTYEPIPPTPYGGSSEFYGTFYCCSEDEGETWSLPIRVSWANTPANPTWLIQLKSGRLMLPNEYSFPTPAHEKHSAMNICTAYLSDDEGKNWRESNNYLFLWDHPDGLIGHVEVPCAAEAGDGRLLMFMRTELRRVAQSYSNDGGENWEPVTLNSLVGSNAEIFLASLPETGDLLCAWNQVSAEESRKGCYRARLSSAVSRDAGKNWENFRTISASPGMDEVSRIVDHDPPSFLRRLNAIPREDQMIANEFWMVRAPRVKFIDGNVYLVYTKRMYRYTDHAMDRFYDAMHLRILPIEWFYQG